MTELLLTALERVPPRVRRVVIAVGALLALGAVMAALTLTNPHGGHKRRAPAQHPAAAGSPRPSPPRIPPPVSTAAMLQAHQVAARFLAGYLPFAYGRGGAVRGQGHHAGAAPPAAAAAGSADAGRAPAPPASCVAADDRHDARVRGRHGGDRRRRPDHVSPAVRAPAAGGRVGGEQRRGGVSSSGAGRHAQAKRPDPARRSSRRSRCCWRAARPLLTVVIGESCTGGGVGDAPSAAAVRDIPGEDAADL